MRGPNNDSVSRRKALELCAVTGGLALTSTDVAADDGERRKANELLLVESGLQYRSEDGELDLSLRMPVDFAPKYLVGTDGITPTPQADRRERKLLFESDAVVSNGSIHPVGERYGEPSNRGYLPLKLRNGRQPIDAAPVEEDVSHPQYSIHREGAVVAADAAGRSERVYPDESAELRFPARTYTVTKHVAVETDEVTAQPEEGEQPLYRHETRTSEERFVPTLSVQNGGRVTVSERRS